VQRKAHLQAGRLPGQQRRSGPGFNARKVAEVAARHWVGRIAHFIPPAKRIRQPPPV